MVEPLPPVRPDTTPPDRRAHARMVAIALLAGALVLLPLSLLLFGLANLGACYSGCTGVDTWRPFLVPLAAATYLSAVATALLLDGRREARRERRGEGRAPVRKGSVAAVAATVVLLGVLVLVSTCFATVFLR